MKVGNLKEFLVYQEGVNVGQGSGSQSDHTLLPPLGVIEVIHAISQGMSLNSRWGILSVMSTPKIDVTDRLEKWLGMISVPITFSEADLEGTS